MRHVWWNTDKYTQSPLGIAGTIFTGPLNLTLDTNDKNAAVTKGWFDNYFLQHSELSSNLHPTTSDIDTISLFKSKLSGLLSLTGLTGDINTQLSEELDKTGGNVTGNITTTSHPVENNDAANKKYLNDSINSGVINKVGDIVNKPNIGTYVGYLRCNGEYKLKSDYSALYNKIGDACESDKKITLNYTLNSSLGGGYPHCNQYDYCSADLNIASCKLDSMKLVYPSAYHTVAVTKNRVYILGGMDRKTNCVYDTIMYSDITDGGLLTGFKIYNIKLPTPVCDHETIIIGNRLYLIGGYSFIDSSNEGYQKTIYYSTISDDGELSNFRQTSFVNTEYYVGFTTLATKNKLYCLETAPGDGSGNTSFCYDINSSFTISNKTIAESISANIDGNPGDWSRWTSIPIGNKVYLLGGGYDKVTNPGHIFVSNINTDGTLGIFTDTGLSLSHITSKGLHDINAWVTLGGNIYIFGGDYSSGGAGGHTNIYKLTITNGVLVSVTVVGKLPIPVSESRAVVTKSKVYIFGGANNYYLSESDHSLNYQNPETYKSDDSIISIDLNSSTGVQDFINLKNINKFNGQSLTGEIKLVNNNPDPALYFKLPDTTKYEKYKTNSINGYYYIKY